MTDQCPVCTSQLSGVVPNPGGRDATKFSCPLCGDFTLTNTLVEDLPSTIQDDENRRTKISHSIRLMQQTGNDPDLSTATVEEILKKPLPNPKEQADNIIRWLALANSNPGVKCVVAPSVHRTIMGAKTAEGFAFVIEHLIEKGLLAGSYMNATDSPGAMRVALSFDGWEYHDQLLRGSGSYRKAFMAMKFGDDDLEQVLESVFKPHCKQAGFDLVKLEDVPIAGLIDDRLRVEIQMSDFIVADLTHDNLGAYWEAGYAEGLGKPVIYTCEKNKFETEKTHFDTNHHLTVIWDKNDPQPAGESLKAIVRATLPAIAIQTDS